MDTISTFDIVIPLGPNDMNHIDTMIHYTKQNIIGYRNIYIVSFDPTIQIDHCITIDETIFPFHKDTIKPYIHNPNRSGWYLQQLIKLYASFVIDDILDDYLVIDADTFFLKPTTFFKDNKPLYNFGSEYHPPYFEHMKKLHPSLYPKFDGSGICHHMMFQKSKLMQLFKLIEDLHHQPFYISFLNFLLPNEESGASEYEIYFNYIQLYHDDDIIIRPLTWNNCKFDPMIDQFDYISDHWYNQ